jgi:hypothetical protein
MILKFSEFIKEEYSSDGQSTRRSEISFNKAIDFYKKYCTDWNLSRIQIYRGINANFEFGIVDPSRYTRVSKNTSNHYTLLLDTFSTWKNYPKRSKSLICTTNSEYAEGFGNGDVYVVIPINGSKIGMCPTGDIWTSFDSLDPYFAHNLKIFNIGIEAILEYCLNPIDYDDITGTELIKYINVAGDKIKEMDNAELKSLTDYIKPLFKLYTEADYIKFVEDFVESNLSLSTFIENLMNPEKNGFDFITTKGQGKLLDFEENEIWTSGKSLLIKEQLFEAFKNQINNNA